MQVVLSCVEWRYARHMANWTVNALVLVVLFVGCSQAVNLQAINPTSVTDSTGVAFIWSCSQSDCSVSAGAGTPPPASCGTKVGSYNYSWWRFVSIYPFYKDSMTPGIYGSSMPEFYRVVSCQTDANCPQPGDATYTCVQGLCQAPNLETMRIDYAEALALCLDSVPRPSDCGQAFSDQRTQDAIVLLSGICTATDCPLPLPPRCRQP
jgi:hypothetical protein